MIGRIGWLLGEQEHDPLKHLVAVQGGHCHVEKEAIQHGLGNVMKNVLKEDHGDANEDVGEDVGEPGLPDMGDHLARVPVGHPGLLVREALDVQGGVGQDGVHEGEAEDGRDHVDDGHHHQVPVVGVTLLQMVLGAVDHRSADVLVHEEQDGQGEPEKSSEEYCGDSQLLERN